MATCGSIDSGITAMAVDAAHAGDRRHLPPIAVLGLVGLLAWAAWRVLSLGLADHFVDERPELALLFREDHPRALLSASERLANSGGDPDQVAALARRAVRAYPLLGRGYRQLAELSTDPAESTTLYTIAAHRSPRDAITLARLVDHALYDADHAAALRHLDQLLRVRPELLQDLYPIFEELVRQPESRPLLAHVLTRSPPWRSAFLRVLARRGPDAASTASLFELLRRQTGGLGEEELIAWLERMISEQLWQQAYLAWASHLPSEDLEDGVGNVFNGSFRRQPSNVGFDWRIGSVPGATIDILPTEGINGTRALRVAFEQRPISFRHVRQLLALAPGSYRLLGRAQLDRVRPRPGLAWTLTCARGGPALASTDSLSGTMAWHEFSAEFEVPSTDCGGQWLTLRLMTPPVNGIAVSGVAWFDDLRVVRRFGRDSERMAIAGKVRCRSGNPCREL